MKGRMAKTRRAVKRALMTPREVADTFEVDPKTVTRWAKAGRLNFTRTLGGHRRYYRDEVTDLYLRSRNSAVDFAPGGVAR